MARFRNGKTGIERGKQFVDPALVRLHHVLCMLVEARPGGLLAPVDVSLLAN